MAEKKKILFLCTGNSCRSQMAEGWANHLRDDEIVAFSAGVAPSVVSERAAKVMAEVGIDLSSHYSKSIDDLPGVDFDLVITLCGNAKESCPVFPGETKVIHKGFDDPDEFTGSDEEVLEQFRRVRDEIKNFIINLAL